MHVQPLILIARRYTTVGRGETRLKIQLSHFDYSTTKSSKYVTNPTIEPEILKHTRNAQGINNKSHNGFTINENEMIILMNKQKTHSNYHFQQKS